MEDGVAKIGEVTRLIRDRAFGFVRDDSGIEYYFHSTGALTPGGFAELAEGDRVTFITEANSRGPRAIDVNRLR